MDGYLDPCAQELGVSSSGEVHLWAGLQDGFLYVATERSKPTPAEDHFIFIAASPGGLAVRVERLLERTEPPAVQFVATVGRRARFILIGLTVALILFHRPIHQAVERLLANIH